MRRTPAACPCSIELSDPSRPDAALRRCRAVAEPGCLPKRNGKRANVRAGGKFLAAPPVEERSRGAIAPTP